MPRFDAAETHRHRMATDPGYRRVFEAAQAGLAEERRTAAKPKPGHETGPKPSKPGRENGSERAGRDPILII